MPYADVVIIGSGIAALIAAERLSNKKNVILFTKGRKFTSNSSLAQGGVAAAIGRQDNWFQHLQDTLVAGAFHNREDAVKKLVQKGPEYITSLIKNGMKFDSDKDGALHLGKEGAHGTRRILHAGGDATGGSLINFLLERLNHKITIIENEMAIDFLVQNKKCVGVTARDQFGLLNNYFAPSVVLATGGCGGLYPSTSNDSSIVGDGIAMAYRIGAQLTDLEFIQFHPTMLHKNGQCCGLVSEAVRGEGGYLLTENGRRIMDGVHKQMDLAPRDIVARTIQKEIRAGEKIFLNISMIANFESRFPTITTLCEKNGITINKGVIPIMPGAHFLMGGVKTDLKGQTSVQGLYAIGEVACTGVHGANRLASNSLLEGIVFANSLADHLLSSEATIEDNIPTDEERFQVHPRMEWPKAAKIQQVMMKYVGIERNKEGLKTAIKWFEDYNVHELLTIDRKLLSKNQLIIVNMMTVGWLIASSALKRTESRGGHFRNDYPVAENHWLKKEIIRQNRTHTECCVGS